MVKSVGFKPLTSAPVFFSRTTTFVSTMLALTLRWKVLPPVCWEGSCGALGAVGSCAVAGATTIANHMALAVIAATALFVRIMYFLYSC